MNPQAMSIQELQRHLTPLLPAGTLQRDPWRCLYLLAAYAVLVGHLYVTSLWTSGETSTPLWLLSLAIVGNICTFPYLYLHEAMHGAVFRSRALAYATSFVGGIFFGLSPYFWSAWHRAHHRHTATQADPDRRFHPAWDRWETILDVAKQRGTVYSWKRVPGIFMALGLISLSQAHFYCGLMLNRGAFPAKKLASSVEYAASLLCFAAPGLLMDSSLAWYGIYLPFGLANWICGAYIITNHANQPLAHHNRPLANSTSVYFFERFKATHMGFGRHTEHHIFPAFTHGKMRAVQRVLRQEFPDVYRETSLFAALTRLFGRSTLLPVIQDDQIGAAAEPSAQLHKGA